MAETEERRRYRYIKDENAPNGQRRVLVVMFRGVEGYEVRFTSECTGCTEYGDYGSFHGPFGCEECGHTGKRRRREWVPFNYVHFEQTYAALSSRPGGETT